MPVEVRLFSDWFYYIKYLAAKKIVDRFVEKFKDVLRDIEITSETEVKVSSVEVS